MRRCRSGCRYLHCRCGCRGECLNGSMCRFSSVCRSGCMNGSICRCSSGCRTYTVGVDVGVSVDSIRF